MSIPSQTNDKIRRLFQKHVPEVAAGVVELVSIARELGKRVVVSVRSRDSGVHPVSACVGMRGVHPKSISRELGGEKVNIVLWDESPETFILNALAPFGPAAVRKPKVTLEAAKHQARVEVDRETLAYFSGEDSSRVGLASLLVGWDIRLITHEHD